MFCIDLVPAYTIFVVVLEGGVKVMETSEFSCNEIPKDVSLKCLKSYKIIL